MTATPRCFSSFRVSRMDQDPLGATSGCEDRTERGEGSANSSRQIASAD